MTDIARLRTLLAAATPGRWIAGATREDGTAQVYCPNRGPMRVIVPVAETEPHNAALIAELRNALPDLLDEVEWLRAHVAKLRDAADLVARAPGCQCNQEVGDSPCPVHGEDEGK